MMDSDIGTTRQEYYYPVIDTESLLFSLLKQGKWGFQPPRTIPLGSSQEMVVSSSSSVGHNSTASDKLCNAANVGRDNCCASCGKLNSSTGDPAPNNNEDNKNHQSDTEIVFQDRQSFRRTTSSSSLRDVSNLNNNKKKLSRALTSTSLCSVNINALKSSAIIMMAHQSPSSSSQHPSNAAFSHPPGALPRHRSSTMSSTSSLSSDNSSSTSSKTRRRLVSRLAKKLKEECDRIFGGTSESLVMDWRMLSAALKEITKEEGKFGVDDSSMSPEDVKYQDLIMFLADLFKFTPTLSITHTVEPKSAETRGLSTSTVDLRRFNNIKYLELKKVSPRSLCNFKSVKRSLTTLKCSRCLDSVTQILTEPLISEAGNCGISTDIKLSCMWPEIKELDLSYNSLAAIDSTAVEALDLCPLLETFNANSNRISGVDDSFSKLNSLSVINLSYNRLKVLPPIPPNCKVLLLSNNYISSLFNNQNNCKNIESFISQSGPYRSLEILDLSANMIASESSFRVLRDISSLKHLAFTGNPICYMESYRNTVLSNLNKLAVSRHFTLDKKRLSSTEVRYAIEQSKKCKYVPQFSSPHQHQHHNPSLMSTSLVMMTSSQTSGSRPSPLSHITSLTQSFDSNSSSLRSSRRKKPKIREISSIDFTESYNENISPGGGGDDESIVRVPLERPGSSLSESRSVFQDNGLEQTRATIKALRDKYGPDNWLLHQHPGRTEVSKIICIPEKPYSSSGYVEYGNPSRSLPTNSEKAMRGRCNSCSRCEGINANNNNNNDSSGGSNSNDKASSDGISVVTSHNNSSGGGSDMGSVSDIYNRNSSNRPLDNSSSGVTGDEEGGPSNNMVQDTSSSRTSGHGNHSSSIFDMNTDYMDEKFPKDSENSEYFRVFLHGQYHNLICYNGFIFEVDPHDSTIYNKWDLNSLISLEEERCDSETETVEFRLRFNTMRKQMRERSFIMCAKDFAKFDKLVSPYIEKRTMEEFIEALQCTRCHAQFSKGMARKTVKHEKGMAPREINVCPTCGNEVLVTLDMIPLPNNECLEVDRGSLENSIPVPIRSSTPCSAEKAFSRSVPKGRSPPLIEAIKSFASSLTSKKQHVGKESPVPPSSSNQNNSLEDKSDCTSETKTATTSSSETVMNTRSDSDIEVLSYESSSIEVLNKCGDSESDEVEVPEAEEVPVPELQSSKTSKGPMSESTSSGSCSESVVTQYERRLHLLPISQPFSSPNPSLYSLSTASSACTSLNSFASNSTLTSASLNSPHKSAVNSTIPVRYDYADYSKVDHRLHLWSELSVFKSAEENLLALAKCMIITDNANVLGLVIFSSLKIYLYKITGVEGDKPQDWLSKVHTYDISKFTRLDVLIGRHGVGVDLSGKYFAMIFRDSERTSNFLEFFMAEICGALESPPMVRDMSQTQKALMCPTSPLAYFGVVRFAVCDIEYSYPVSAIVLTQEDIILITDLSWMSSKTSDKVLAKHCKPLASIRQIEFMESDPTLVRLICDNTKWELLFETEREKDAFLSTIRSDLQISVPSITVCTPIEA